MQKGKIRVPDLKYVLFFLAPKGYGNINKYVHLLKKASKNAYILCSFWKKPWDVSTNIPNPLFLLFYFNSSGSTTHVINKFLPWEQ